MPLLRIGHLRGYLRVPHRRSVVLPRFAETEPSVRTGGTHRLSSCRTDVWYLDGYPLPKASAPNPDTSSSPTNNKIRVQMRLFLVSDRLLPDQSVYLQSTGTSPWSSARVPLPLRRDPQTDARFALRHQQHLQRTPSCLSRDRSLNCLTNS